MRGMNWALVAAVGLSVGQAAHAQSYPAEMVVTAAQVYVRSGPTKEYFETALLRQGDRVIVLRESKDQPGWLAIKPPKGSFSWINAKHVKQVDPRTAYVELESGPVSVMPGSAVVNKAPNVESVKVIPGSLLVIVDKAHTADGNTWLPIEPPPTEVRFIPADAVRPLGTGIPFSPAPANPLIAQADQAFNAGQRERARVLYKEAADKTTNSTELEHCYMRLASLAKDSSAATSPFHTASGKTPTSPPGVTPAIGKAITYPAQWSSWGTLRQATFEKDGQPVYYLESKDKRALLYVVSEPGKSLRGYLGQMVCIYGAISYRPDDRTHFMTASHVATP